MPMVKVRKKNRNKERKEVARHLVKRHRKKTERALNGTWTLREINEEVREVMANIKELEGALLALRILSGQDDEKVSFYRRRLAVLKANLRRRRQAKTKCALSETP